MKRKGQRRPKGELAAAMWDHLLVVTGRTPRAQRRPLTPHQQEIAERIAQGRKRCAEHNRALALDPDRAERRRQERLEHRLAQHRPTKEKA